MLFPSGKGDFPYGLQERYQARLRHLGIVPCFAGFVLSAGPHTASRLCGRRDESSSGPHRSSSPLKKSLQGRQGPGDSRDQRPGPLLSVSWPQPIFAAAHKGRPG